VTSGDATRALLPANPSLSTLDWSRLDTYLAGLKLAEVDDIF